MPDSFGTKLGVAIDEFLTLARAGQAIEIQEFAKRFPDIEQELLDVLPSMQMIESAGREESKIDSRIESRVPNEIGGHRIVREIGRGGMGIVYEAIDPSLKRHVALKVLSGMAFLDSGHLERFKREAQAVANLSHPNIIPVFSVGESDDVHYFTMQQIKGISLAELIRRLQRGAGYTPSKKPTDATKGELTETVARSFGVDLHERNRKVEFENTHQPKSYASTKMTRPSATNASSEVRSGSQKSYFKRVAEIGLQLTEGVEHAHANGVLHRDIKPANVLLDENGKTWIADFGLAKSADSNLTQSGELVGTLRYLSPERLRGTDSESSDIYAIGATIYELLTLQPAYASSDRAQLIHDVLYSSPLKPRAIDEQIPRSFEMIVMKAMAPEPSMRYESASDLADDLRRYLENRPVMAKPVSVTARVGLWAKRNPISAGLLSLLFMTVVGAAYGSWSFWSKLDRQLEETSVANQMADGATLVAQRRLFDVSKTAARQNLANRNVGCTTRARASLDNAIKICRQFGFDTEEQMAELRQIGIEIESTFDLYEDDNSWSDTKILSADPSYAFDSSLSRIARLDKKFNVVIQDAQTGKTLITLPDQWSSPILKFSPDNRFLMLRGYRNSEGSIRFVVWDIDESTAVFDQLIHGNPNENTFSMSSDADGSWIVFLDGDQSLCLADPSVGEVVFRKTMDSRPVEIVLNGTGSYVLIASRDKVKTFVVSGNKIHMDQPDAVFSDSQNFSCAAWHPVGNAFATGGSRGSVLVWNANNPQQPELVLRGHNQEVTQLAFDRTGRILMSRSKDNSTRFWETRYGQLLLVAGPSGSRFSADGNRFGFEDFDHGYHVASLSDLLVKRVATGRYRDRCVSDISWSDDQKLMVWGSDGGWLSMWDPNSGLTTRLTDRYYQSISIAFDKGSHSELLAYSHPYLDKFKFASTIKNGRLLVDTSQFRTVGEFEKILDVQKIDEETVLAADGSNQLLKIRTVESQTDLDLKKVKMPFQVHQISVSADGKVAAGASHVERRMIVVDLADSKIIGQYTTSERCKVCVSNNGEQVAVTSPAGMSILNVPNMEVQHQVDSTSMQAGTGCFSNNGKMLALVEDGQVQIFETDRYTRLIKFTAPLGDIYTARVRDPLTGIAFSPDDESLAIGTQNNEVHIWNIDRMLGMEILQTQTGESSRK